MGVPASANADSYSGIITQPPVCQPKQHLVVFVRNELIGDSRCIDSPLSPAVFQSRKRRPSPIPSLKLSSLFHRLIFVRNLIAGFGEITVFNVNNNFAAHLGLHVPSREQPGFEVRYSKVIPDAF